MPAWRQHRPAPPPAILIEAWPRAEDQPQRWTVTIRGLAHIVTQTPHGLQCSCDDHAAYQCVHVDLVGRIGQGGTRH